jgi:hypothetical protein
LAGLALDQIELQRELYYYLVARPKLQVALLVDEVGVGAYQRLQFVHGVARIGAVDSLCIKSGSDPDFFQ